MSDVVIFGTSDYSRIAAVYLREDSPHDVVAFTVHQRYREVDELLGIPVVPFERLAESHPPDRCEILVAVGYSEVNKVRTRLYEECKALGYDFITYVNSSVRLYGDIEIGENSFIFEDNVVQPFVTIGDNVVLWSGNHIGHDATIGDHCFIASHAVISGHASIGRSCFVGVNATFRDGVKVADECVIGAGALIMKDTEPGGVYAVRGTPAIPRKSWELRDF